MKSRQRSDDKRTDTVLGDEADLGEIDELSDRSWRFDLPHVRSLSRLQRDHVCTRRGIARGVVHRPDAGAADVHRRVHGEDGRLRQALLPGVHARRDLRQGNRAVRILQGDRLVGDQLLSDKSGRCLHRAGLRDTDLRGVSLVVVFAVYPFAAEMFRQGGTSSA